MAFYIYSRCAAWVTYRYSIWAFVCGESNERVCHLAQKYKYFNMNSGPDWLQQKVCQCSTGLLTAPTVKCKCVATNAKRLMKSCTVWTGTMLAGA